MAGEPQLKIRVNADTSGYQKGMQQTKQGLKDVEKVSNDALSKIGNAFGVNTGKVQQLTSALGGVGKKFQEIGVIGGDAFSTLTSGLTALETGLAGLGIAGVVAAFKQLNDEADYFLSRAGNTYLTAGSEAFRDTFTDVMHDLNIGIGESAGRAKLAWKDAWTVIGGTAKSSLLGIFTDGSLATGAIKAIGNAGIAKAIADEARPIAEEINKINREMLNREPEWEKMRNEIEEYRAIAQDTSNDRATRAEAIQNAEAAIKTLYSEQKDDLQRIATLTAQLSEKAQDDEAAEKAKVMAQKQAVAAATQETQQLRSLLRLKNSVLNAQEKTTKSVKEEVTELDKMLARLSSLNERNIFLDPVDAIIAPDVLTGVATTTENNALALPVKPVLDQKALVEMTSALEAGVASMSEAIGGLVGDLITGGDAWKNFGNAAMSAFADMAMSIGKIAIATGIAASGIKAALELHPEAAIAAGAALVALGAAVKAGLSNVAAGSTASYGSSIASSAYSRNGSESAYGRTINVEVTGTLSANGSTLVAVLNNESNRKNYTT
jgi:hypothetical protein